MTQRGRLLLAGALGLAAGAAAMAAMDRAVEPGRARIEAIVRAYILDHPEILPQAMERLHARETGALIAQHRARLETPFGNAWDGARDGDVTVVQFFDYACGYCRASAADIARLVRDDPRVRVVYREFPVLGPESDLAARASLTAARGGGYRALHKALYALDGLTEERVRTLAARAGVGTAGDGAIEAEIASNRMLARTLGVSGTPSWIVGDRLLAGAVGYDALKAAVAEARARP